MGPSPAHIAEQSASDASAGVIVASAALESRPEERMSEVLVEFDTVLVAPDGTGWTPRACGGIADDGLWEGWVEFASTDGTVHVRTARETEQPNREDLAYWATGLTQVYLEGALRRAIESPRRPPPSDLRAS
jgi:hypothetical protein